MRRLWLGAEKSLGWDDPIPEFMKSEWIKFFIELFEMETVKFRRLCETKGCRRRPRFDYV